MMLVYLTPVAYLLLNYKKLKLKNLKLITAGFIFLAFGAMLDFLDSFEFLKKVFPDESMYPWQDFFEDIIGYTLGMFLLIRGLYLELKEKNSGNI